MVSITTTQAVLCNVDVPLQREARLTSLPNQQHERIPEREAFIKGFVPSKDDVGITTYTAKFIFAVYRFQHKFTTDNEHENISATNLLMFLFEGYRTKTDTRYFDVINESTATRAGIDNSIDTIRNLRERLR